MPDNLGTGDANNLRTDEKVYKKPLSRQTETLEPNNLSVKEIAKQIGNGLMAGLLKQQKDALEQNNAPDKPIPLPRKKKGEIETSTDVKPQGTGLKRTPALSNKGMRGGGAIGM